MKIWNFHQTIPEVLNKYLGSNFPWVRPQLLWMPGIALPKLGPPTCQIPPATQIIILELFCLSPCCTVFLWVLCNIVHMPLRNWIMTTLWWWALCLLQFFVCSACRLFGGSSRGGLVSNSRLHQRLLWDGGGESKPAEYRTQIIFTSRAQQTGLNPILYRIKQRDLENLHT